MRPRLLKTGILLTLMAVFTFTSCSKDDSADTPVTDTSSELTAEQSKQAAETDETTDAVLSMIDMAFAENEDRSAVVESYFPDCVTIIVSTENDVTFVTLDFGLGCELHNGAIVSGMVHFTHGPVVAETVTITYTFENFTYNNKGVEGGGSIFRERNNANGNPQSTANKDIVVTFPNGVVATVDGTRVAEWIEGAGSGIWRDNVFLVTGNRDIDFSSGFSHYSIVTEALRKETTCPFFVSGTIEITRNNGEGVLDFGDGECDNVAILTVNGQEIIIILN